MLGFAPKPGFSQQDLPTSTKETGFFTESAGNNEIFSQKNPVSAYPCVQNYTKAKYFRKKTRFLPTRASKNI